jgi:hypothetical protein
MYVYGATHGVTMFQVTFRCHDQVMYGYSGPDIIVKFAQRLLQTTQVKPIQWLGYGTDDPVFEYQQG